MNLVITTKKELDRSKTVLLNCVFRAYWVGYQVSDFEEAIRSDTHYRKDAYKSFARSVLNELEAIYETDKDAGKFAKYAATEYELKKMIKALGDEGEKYLWMLE